jgi:hypothetical protein
METNSPTDAPTPAPTPEIPAETPPAAEPPVDASVAADSGEPPVASSEPVAAEPADAVDSVAPEGGVPDELTQLAEASQRARLAPAEEERMGQLLKDALQGGRAGVARAVEALPKVPWIVGVRAVEAVWPDLTAGFRTQLVSGLAKDESDASRRIRLSLARAFFKIDMPTGLKVAAGVVRELRDTETGLITPKQAQIFANVFVGRGKPWLAQLSLAEMKPADGDALAHCAVLAVFTLPHPPVTQLGVLKWVAEQGRLGKLDASALEVMKKGLSRWSAKWQSALRKEVDGLPEEIIASLKPLPGTAPEAGEESATGSGEGAEGETAAAGEGAEGAEEDIDEEEDEDDDDEDEEEEDGEEEKSRKARPVYEPRPQKPQAERPVYTPRNSGGGAPKNFNINESLRNIDAYVQSLRNDLSAAQAKLRSRDDRRRPEKIGAIVEGEPTVEELARLNLQLEARNSELQDRIKELTQHAEDVAVSTGALTGQPVDDGALQLRTLLALKLQEDFADFHALESETNDQVVQQHYKTLLRHVFEVLQQLDVPLKA